MKRNFLFSFFFAAAFLFQTVPVMAQLHGEPSSGSVTALDEKNISAFLKDTSEISSGQRTNMADEDVITYFTDHITEHAHFKSEIHYEMPGYPVQDTTLNLSREDYTSSVIASRFTMEDYSASIEIQDLKIMAHDKEAVFTSIIKENGKMAVPKSSENSEETEIVPVEGQSICEQKLVISPKGSIQIG